MHPVATYCILWLLLITCKLHRFLDLLEALNQGGDESLAHQHRVLPLPEVEAESDRRLFADPQRAVQPLRPRSSTEDVKGPWPDAHLLDFLPGGRFALIPPFIVGLLIPPFWGFRQVQDVVVVGYIDDDNRRMDRDITHRVVVQVVAVLSLCLLQRLSIGFPHHRADVRESDSQIVRNLCDKLCILCRANKREDLLHGKRSSRLSAQELV
jgi:hypothetical protein